MHDNWIQNGLDSAGLQSSSNYYSQYIQHMNPSDVDVLFVGINPGPKGMGINGVSLS